MVRVLSSQTLLAPAAAAALLFLATTTTATSAFVPPQRLLSLRPTVLDATNLPAKTTTKEETFLLNEDKFLADLDAYDRHNRMGVARSQVEVFGEPRYIVEARRNCAALAGRAQELQEKYTAEIKILRNKSVWDTCTTEVVKKKTNKEKRNHSSEFDTMEGSGSTVLLALALAGTALVVQPEAVTDIVSAIHQAVTLPTTPVMSHFELPNIKLPTVDLTTIPSLDDFQLPVKLPNMNLPKLDTNPVTGWFHDLKTQMPNMVPLSVEETIRGWQDTVTSQVESSSSLLSGWFQDVQTKIQGTPSLLDEAGRGWRDSSFAKVEAAHNFKTNTIEPSLMSSEDLNSVLREWSEHNMNE